MLKKKKRPDKFKGVEKLVHERAKAGRILPTDHSTVRHRQRFVTFSETMQVLERGRNCDQP